MNADEIRQLALENSSGIAWFAADIDPKHERIIAACYEEDPDFVELWVIFLNGEPSIRLDRENPGIEIPRPEWLPSYSSWQGHYDLINQPLGKIIWADNARDVVWTDRDGRYVWRVHVDESVWAITGIADDKNTSEAEKQRLEVAGFWP